MSGVELAQRLVDTTKEFKAQMNKLYSSNKISREFKSSSTAAFDCIASFLCKNSIYSLLVGNGKAVIPQDEMKIALAELSHSFPVFSEANLQCPMGRLNFILDAKLISEGLLKGPSSSINAWDSTQYAFLNYVPEKFQEFMIASFLINQASYDKQGFDDLRTYFSTRYPKSIFNDRIKFDDHEISDKMLLNKQDCYIYYELINGQLDVREVGRIPLDNVKHFFKSIAKGKPLFVDVWATWCTPCLVELNQSSLVHDFLKKHGVAILYLSIDRKEAMRRWNLMIIESKLDGYHMDLSKEGQTCFNRFLKSPITTIPRFLIVDGDGNVVVEKH